MKLAKDTFMEDVLRKLDGLCLCFDGLSSFIREGGSPTVNEVFGISILLHEIVDELNTLISTKSPMDVLIAEAMERVPLGVRNWTVATPESIKALAEMLMTIARERRGCIEKGADKQVEEMSSVEEGHYTQEEKGCIDRLLAILRGKKDMARRATIATIDAYYSTRDYNDERREANV